MSENIAALIVDDHDFFRQTLKDYLGNMEAIAIVGEAKNGSEAIDLAEKLKPQLVLMDINMPYMDGITAYGLLKKQSPSIKVVLYSMYDIESFNSFPSFPERDVGIYLSKDKVFEDLPKVIEQIKKGLFEKETALKGGKDET